MRNYTAIVEKCPQTGLYVGYIPNFPGAHSQSETLDELYSNMREVVEMVLEDGEPALETDFIGTQTIVVAWVRVIIMGKQYPVWKPKEVMAILDRLGFVKIRQRGSHVQYRHPDGRGATVPFHQERNISHILLRQIAKDIGLTIDDLLKCRS